MPGTVPSHLRQHYSPNASGTFSKWNSILWMIPLISSLESTPRLAPHEWSPEAGALRHFRRIDFSGAEQKTSRRARVEIVAAPNPMNSVPRQARSQKQEKNKRRNSVFVCKMSLSFYLSTLGRTALLAVWLRSSQLSCRMYLQRGYAISARRFGAVSGL